MVYWLFCSVLRDQEVTTYLCNQQVFQHCGQSFFWQTRAPIWRSAKSHLKKVSWNGNLERVLKKLLMKAKDLFLAYCKNVKLSSSSTERKMSLIAFANLLHFTQKDGALFYPEPILQNLPNKYHIYIYIRYCLLIDPPCLPLFSPLVRLLQTIQHNQCQMMALYLKLAVHFL